MSEFQITQEKIHALLKEFRTWEADEKRYSLYELTKKFGLDRLVVDRVARSEGVHLQPAEEFYSSGPADSTLDLDPSDIQQALDQPEPDPKYQPDVDTGVWHKNPTGEWERVPPTRDEDH